MSTHQLNTTFFMALPAHLSQSPRPHSLLLGFSPFQFPSQPSFSGEIYDSSSVLPGSVPQHGGTAAQVYSSSWELHSWAGTRAPCPREGTVAGGLVSQVLSRTKPLLFVLVSVSGVAQLCQSTGTRVPNSPPFSEGGGEMLGVRGVKPKPIPEPCVSSTEPCPCGVCDSAPSVAAP